MRTRGYRISGYGMSGISAFIKRALDIIFAAVFLVVLSPLFVVIAICVKADGGGRVFYCQTRCTRDMRQFRIFKFRSMESGAKEESGAHLAERNDPRMTRVGRFLRKYKLDELPQLINILKGDMSWVGPRPERPERMREIMTELPEFEHRTAVKAGLTGYAQVRGGYYTAPRDKLKWDLFYIEHYSLLLDLKILLMTVPVVWKGGDDV